MTSAPVTPKLSNAAGGALFVPPRRRKPGPVEAKARADIEALITAHPMGETLAEMSLNLARAMDEDPGLLRAALNRELRANLVELARMGVPDDDDLADRLSTPVRDTENPGEGDSGTGGR
jgi:hypothetical protein